MRPLSTENNKKINILYYNINTIIVIILLIHFMYPLVPELRVTGVCWSLTQLLKGKGYIILYYISPSLLKSRMWCSSPKLWTESAASIASRCANTRWMRRGASPNTKWTRPSTAASSSRPRPASSTQHPSEYKPAQIIVGGFCTAVTPDAPPPHPFHAPGSLQTGFSERTSSKTSWILSGPLKWWQRHFPSCCK